MSPAATQIVETIDGQLTAMRDEQARLQAARRALVGRGTTSARKRTTNGNGRATNGRGSTHKQNVARAIQAIQRHPGRPAKEMKLAPVAVSALSRSGRIVREGEGWKEAP